MNNDPHIPIEDLALFSMSLLGSEEVAVVQEHLEGCALCLGELSQLRESLALYALSVPPVALPAGARDRFVAAMEAGPAASRVQAGHPGVATAHQRAQSDGVGTTAGSGQRLAFAEAGSASSMPTDHAAATSPTEARIAPAVPVGKARVLPWVAWAGWAAAAAMLVVATGLKQDRDALRGALTAENAQFARIEADAARAEHVLHALSDPSAVRVNLALPKAPAAPGARATYEPRSGTLLLQASNMAPLPGARVYELWLIPADGGKPLPAGTFAPDAHGNASLLMPRLASGAGVKAFGITIEPVGGSATPTMPIVLAGAPA
ncbi:anti-sigma factor [Acidipila sp. EB88]|uniref:anti-sigma factor n=1 Tax=Acidipila sp. EB88 TaxID=2305226 RepID=UPI000F5F5BB1|nr:anti-sigma factor [Acidipila sp. EB88]RRA47547.1 hypothetical protein D1Y84_03775 [Acidipila sp. EB88]